MEEAGGGRARGSRVQAAHPPAEVRQSRVRGAGGVPTQRAEARRPAGPVRAAPPPPSSPAPPPPPPPSPPRAPSSAFSSRSHLFAPSWDFVLRSETVCCVMNITFGTFSPANFG